MNQLSTITAIGYIKDGSLTITNRNRLSEELTRFKDCAVELTIRKKNRRSNAQNAYIWGVVYKELEIRMRELGNDVNSDDVHDFCKERFNPKELIGQGGEVIGNKGGSTTEMNKEEFGIYLDKIIAFALEYLDLIIPYPNQDLQLMFDKEYKNK